MGQGTAGAEARKSGNEGQVRHLFGQNTNGGTQGHETETAENSSPQHLSPTLPIKERISE